MPTISFSHADLQTLLGRSASLPDIEAWLPLVKGELKDYLSSTGELRVELQDSNRPDLWCVEGIARQIRIALTNTPPVYPFWSTKGRIKRRVLVLPETESVRPYIAACGAVGYQVTEAGLTQLIQTQEKLAEIFGRKRQTVSIGIYRLSPLAFPLTYGLVKPTEVRFTPLGFSEKMTLEEILAVHPKGVEYGHILSGHEKFPLFWDKEGQILSFPPIINSRDIGEVRVGDTDLLLEVTGTDLRMVLLTLNILATNLADRGASIEPVDVVYPYATEVGTIVRTPFNIARPQRVRASEIERALGMALGTEAIEAALRSYGHHVKATRHTLSVTPPPYRDDLMHAVDVAEDVAISRGYDAFQPLMPTQFTVGALSQIEQLSDQIRTLMIGFGFQEIFSNILMARDELIERMRLTESEHEAVVEVANPLSLSYACLRSAILPCLLRVEATSPRAFYPHKLFEIGEVASPDPRAELGSETKTHLALLLASATANFSEIHAVLDVLLYYLLKTYRLEPIVHPSYLEGRVGQIVYEGQAIGVIGELHPEVLEAWQITMPIAAVELHCDKLISPA
ncbi:MAG: phenylalanine--tRNA ligase subunit beta [Nitrospirae bacterium]|nr:MAG: phenylalanine--tRNA ligase subunit beta [Nitrospirota bacterium]